MDGNGAHPRFVGLEKDFARCGRKIHCLSSLDKIIETEHAIIEQRQDGRLDNERPELFHDIQCQSRSAKSGLVVEADIRIESNYVCRYGTIFSEQTVSKRQKRI